MSGEEAAAAAEEEEVLVCQELWNNEICNSNDIDKEMLEKFEEKVCL